MRKRGFGMIWRLGVGVKKFSSVLAGKLKDLRLASIEERTKAFNEAIPLVIEQPSSLNDLLLFFQHFEQTRTVKTDFQQYLGLFSRFFDKYPKTLSLKHLETSQITSLLELFINFPELLTKNPGFFNSLDVFCLKNKDLLPAESQLKVLLLAMKVNKGSEKLVDSIEKNTHFPSISTETLLNFAISLRNSERITLGFAESLYSELKTRKNDIKPLFWLDVLYILASLNVPGQKELFINGIDAMKRAALRGNIDIMRFLWTLVYFSLRYNENLNPYILENAVSSLKNWNFNSKMTTNRHFAYKIHEIELFLRKKCPETFEKSWKFENNMPETEWFRGSLDKLGSILQKDLEIILKIAKIGFEREKRVERVYLLDFFIPERSIAIEINGPQHYSFHKRSQDAIINGSSFVKQEILHSYGINVKNVSYNKWYGLKGVREKIDFVNNVVYGD